MEAPTPEELLKPVKFEFLQFSSALLLMRRRGIKNKEHTCAGVDISDTYDWWTSIYPLFPVPASQI